MKTKNNLTTGILTIGVIVFFINFNEFNPIGLHHQIMEKV